MQIIWWITGLVVTGIVIFLFYYNKLKTLENDLKLASVEIDVALTKCFDLILNLVTVVKSYINYEQAEVTTIKSQSLNRNTQNKFLNKEFEKIITLVEDYPKLKTNNQFLKLKSALVDVQEHLQALIRVYNVSVAKINTMIVSFPGNIFNLFLKKKSQLYFEAESVPKDKI